jgi:chromosomal replication initiation ATPase DnaA
MKTTTNEFTPGLMLPRIVTAFCQVTGVDRKAIYSRSRRAEDVVIRHALIWCIRQMTDYGWSTLGRFFKRDHAAMMNGYRRISDRIDTNDKFKRQAIKLLAAVTKKTKTRG